MCRSSVLPKLAGSLALVLSCAVAQAETQPQNPRIVNGIETQLRPATGALLVDLDGALSGICSGTLIGCQHFVTAAHCVCTGPTADTCHGPGPATFRVYLQHAGVLGVSSVDVNPGFAFGGEGDVAVLTLAAPVSGIRPMPVNTTGDPPAGLSGIIAGYGVTAGANNAFGLLREGSVTLSGCGDAAPEPAHVCWTFDDPVGPPGTDSNTCGGDSGGPLFLDLGSGSVLAGVTAGGLSGTCQPPDISFDSNVFRNLTFIASVAGSDLSAPSCGNVTPTGESGTRITAVSFKGISNEVQVCRKQVVKGYASYARARLKLMQECLGRVSRGSIAGPCPDEKTAGRIARAAARVREKNFVAKCAPATIGAMRVAGACAGAFDGASLRSCLLSAADDTVDGMLDVQYAEPALTGPMADQRLRGCQKAIASALARYGIIRLQSLATCHVAEDRGQVAGCPDGRARDKIASRAKRVQSAIAAKCTDAEIDSLNRAGGTFGGSCSSAGTVTDLASCGIAEHDARTDALIGLLETVSLERWTTVSVPNGTARLTITVNGADPGGANDLDLYARWGAPPSTTSFTDRSTNIGVYEGIDLWSPTPGLWHVLVNPVAGTNVPFQLTITTFQQP